MIGVDTNVLVRAYLEDDKEQAKEAQEFLKENFDFKLTIAKYAPIIDFTPINISKIKNVFAYENSQFSDYFPQFINFYKNRKGIK